MPSKVVNDYFELKTGLKKIMAEPENGKIYGIGRSLVVISDTEAIPEFDATNLLLVSLVIMVTLILFYKYRTVMLRFPKRRNDDGGF